MGRWSRFVTNVSGFHGLSFDGMTPNPRLLRPVAGPHHLDHFKGLFVPNDSGTDPATLTVKMGMQPVLPIKKMTVTESLGSKTSHICVPTGMNTWRKQRKAVLAEIREAPDPMQAAALHYTGLVETTVEFVTQQSLFVLLVCQELSHLSFSR